MNPIILAAFAGMTLAGLPALSLAACAAPSVRVATAAAMTTLLQNNTACVPALTQPTMEAQELHRPDGTLFDYKRGPGHLGDPSAQVGSWKVTGGPRAVVTHDYGGGVRYTYELWNNNDGTHSFCSANPEVKARIKTGGGPC